MGTTKRDASKEIGGAGRRYRSPERWKRNAGVPAIRPATVAAKIQENAIRSQRTKAPTAPRRSTTDRLSRVNFSSGKPARSRSRRRRTRSYARVVVDNRAARKKLHR